MKKVPINKEKQDMSKTYKLNKEQLKALVGKRTSVLNDELSTKQKEIDDLKATIEVEKLEKELNGTVKIEVDENPVDTLYNDIFSTEGGE